MTFYAVYRQKEYVKYYHNIFSRATLFVILFSLTPLFVSVIAAYRAYGFYKTSVIIATQPIVSLQPDMALTFLSDGGSVYSWSNLQMAANPSCLPVVSITEIDSNYDGINESLNMTVKLYKKSITGIKFLLQFDYNVSTTISTLKLQQPILIFVDAQQTARKLIVTGRLDVYQKRRLPNSGVLTIYNNTYYNSSSSASVLANPYDNLIGNTSDRNFTVKLVDLFTGWQFSTNPNLFEVNIEILYNPVELQYHTEFWSMVKWAWVQWFYFLVIFVFCFQRFKEFVFESFAVSYRKQLTQMHKCDIQPIGNTTI